MDSRSELFELRRRFVPPRGLDRSRPRDVRLTAAGNAVMIVAVLLFSGAVAAGILLQRVAVRQAAAQRLMLESGVVTSAEVTRLWRGSDDSKQPWVAYRFEAGGRLHEGRSKIRLSKWRGLEAGASLPVRYLPANPLQSIFAERAPEAMPFWVPPLAATTLALGGWPCLFLVRAERRLLMEGRATPAIVRTHRKYHTSHGGNQRSMTYEFPLLTGAMVTGKCGTSSKPPAIGSVICVIYDPDRPKRSKPYPLSLVRPGA